MSRATASENWEFRRKPVNDRSRENAHNYREFWEPWEVELILDWDHTSDELEVLADLLGRTTESIRIIYSLASRGLWHERVRSETHIQRRTVTTTTTTTTTYLYDNWPQDECSEWYR